MQLSDFTYSTSATKKGKTEDMLLMAWFSTSREGLWQKTKCWLGKNLNGRRGARVVHVWNSVKTLIDTERRVAFTDNFERNMPIPTWSMIIFSLSILLSKNSIFCRPRSLPPAFGLRGSSHHSGKNLMQAKVTNWKC